MRSERPRRHLTAQRGWINDPTGLIHHGGRYHVFYQYVPDRSTWALPCQWGHASSTDLTTWTEHPPALAPGDGDDGCWSGCVVATADGPRILYTSIRAGETDFGEVRSATPLDADLIRWRKGPVVVRRPEALGDSLLSIRDPYVRADGDGWRMVIGASLVGGHPAALTYTSPDVERWTYDGVVASAEPDDPVTGESWECPQLFALDDAWVLLVSVMVAGAPSHLAYAVGSLTDGRFAASSWHRLTLDDVPYAGYVFDDAAGRAGLIAWLRGVSAADGSWTGALSLPYRLSVDGDRLQLSFHPDVVRDGDALDHIVDACIEERLSEAGFTVSVAARPE